ncbi:MAG TPA: sigma-54 factor interaction domain-containing protein, partial [Dehalococcoidia bacterium]|nr:sigma-54 factor interaction domain-containing protein [Dehalococcoidia bacterium]
SSVVWPIQDLIYNRHYFATFTAPLHLRSANVRIAESSTSQHSSSKINKGLSKNSELTLEQLTGSDQQMINIAAKIRKIADRRISIILSGETGSGKDALALAIHRFSERRAKAFVSINCASIPESLIESELFGYAHGAFTGARKSGHHGKIVASDGGTLFLNEIGDMAPELQTRLLQVLETGEVTPLGSNKSVPVDLYVLCATHRDLPELIANGGFRQDLYYRLAGINLRLPPLR